MTLRVEEEDADVGGSEDGGTESDASAAAPAGVGNPSWADAMQRILRVDVEEPERVILSRRGKLKLRTAADGEDKADLGEPAPKKNRAETANTKLARKEWNEMCRVKPSALDRERERRFAKIATKGVVQLFNAVEQHQKKLKTQLSLAGPCESQKEKTLASCGEGLFLDVLNRQKMKKERRIKKELESSDESDEDDGPESRSGSKTKSRGWDVLDDKKLKPARIKDWNSGSDDSD